MQAALQVAAERGHADMVKYLLAAGADSKSKTLVRCTTYYFHINWF